MPFWHVQGGRFISHRWVEIRIDQRPRSGTAFKQSLSFVIHPMVPRGIERLGGEWLGCGVLPRKSKLGTQISCVYRALSASKMRAGFADLGVCFGARYVDRGCSRPRLQPGSHRIKTRNMDLQCTQGIDSCDWKTQRLLGDSVPKCALACSEK